jgi:hypothetical protein
MVAFKDALQAANASTANVSTLMSDTADEQGHEW